MLRAVLLVGESNELLRGYFRDSARTFIEASVVSAHMARQFGCLLMRRTERRLSAQAVMLKSTTYAGMVFSREVMGDFTVTLSSTRLEESSRGAPELMTEARGDR
jgi:hypothetical protein